MTFKNFLILTGIVGVAFIIGLTVHGAFLASRTDDGSMITVTGSTKMRITSDMGKWVASFSRSATPATLKQEIEAIGRDMDKVRAFAVSLGLDAASVTVLPISTDPVYEPIAGGYGTTQNVIGYVVRQEVRIENKDIEKVERLGKETKKLIDQGVVPQFQRTEYFYTQLDALRPRLFADATSDARMRAAAIASGTEVQVGELRSARTGIIQILAPNSTDISDYGSYDTTTKEKDISATVTVTFELED